MKITIILLCTLVLHAISVKGQLNEGDGCVTHNYELGQCKKLSECISVEAIIQVHRFRSICRFNIFTMIVCCPSTQPYLTGTSQRVPSTTSTTTTTIRSTTTKRTSATERWAQTTTRTPTTKTTQQGISTGISVKKCNEYKEYAYNIHYRTTLFGQPPQAQKVLNCAFTSTPFIVGGTTAKKEEFPHMALIGYGDSIHSVRWNCGGTLISEQFVLSAGHCFDLRGEKPKYVRLGEYDQDRTDDGTTIDLEIIRSFLHSGYHHPSRYNDIVLFKFEREIELTNAIRPACLPEQSYLTNDRAIVSGWGANSSLGMSSNVLLKATLEMFSQDECNAIHSAELDRKLKQGILEETQICAGSRTEATDTCQDDSGGPLQIYHTTHNCTYTVIGVTSFGKFCGAIGTPGVYTRVFAYLSWIENIVWPGQ